MSKNFYTAAQDEWLKAHINDVCKWTELVQRFNETFNQQRTLTGIKRHCWGVLHLTSNRNGCFQKGNISHNKRDIGSEHWENGYLWVKVDNKVSQNRDKRVVRSNWKQKHILIWEEAHGKLPEGKQVVFLDGDKTNFDLDNLYCVDLGVMAVMNRNKWFTDSRENTLTAIKWCELHFALKGV